MVSLWLCASVVDLALPTTDDQRPPLKPHQHRFHLQRHAPLFRYALLDFVLELHDLSSSSAAAIHDCERMLSRNSYMAFAVAFGEP